MLKSARPATNMADVLLLLDTVDMPAIRRRDMLSAVRRICEMLDVDPGYLQTDPVVLRPRLAAIRPAAQRVSAKTFSNLRSLFVAALEIAGAIDPTGRGEAKQDPSWGRFVNSIAHDKRMSNGLAAFANWCTRQGIAPADIVDDAVQRFSIWLETRTLCPRPRDIVRGIPKIWNEASASIEGWPTTTLTRISFKVASANLAWSALEPSFRVEAEAYLQMRAKPDIFDIDPNAPKRPLSPRLVWNQREHIRLAASILARDDSFGSPKCLADVVTPQALKAVLRHYHAQAGGKPSAQAIGTGKTIVDLARYHAKLPEAALKELKAIASKLPAMEFDLSEKNKQLLRLLECDDARARLLFLPQLLIRRAKRSLQNGRSGLVEAQVGIAVDILLVAPLRLQNLIA